MNQLKSICIEIMPCINLKIININIYIYVAIRHLDLGTIWTIRCKSSNLKKKLDIYHCKKMMVTHIRNFLYEHLTIEKTVERRIEGFCSGVSNRIGKREEGDEMRPPARFPARGTRLSIMSRTSYRQGLHLHSASRFRGWPPVRNGPPARVTSIPWLRLSSLAEITIPVSLVWKKKSDECHRYIVTLSWGDAERRAEAGVARPWWPRRVWEPSDLAIFLRRSNITSWEFTE